MDNRVIAGAVAIVAAGGAVTYVLVRRRRQPPVAALAGPTGEDGTEGKSTEKAAKKAQQAAADKAAADQAAADKAVADAVAAARAAADQMADDQPKTSRRAAALATLRPAASNVAGTAVRFAGDHQADLIDIVTLILTRNNATPSPTDPRARRQAELMVEQALAVMKMLTDQAATDKEKSGATPGAAPA